MWFKSTDITKHNPIYLDNLHGYVLPHAGTSYTKHILSHTLRFRPTKKFKYILIIFLPAGENPDVGENYHEYSVPLETLKVFYPRKTYIKYNILDTPPDISKLNKENTLYVVSADFSHFLDLQSAIHLENCAAHSLMHKRLNNECNHVVDNIRNFKRMYTLLPGISLQWIGRTRSPGEKGVGYLSFLLRDKPNKKPDRLFITAYDNDMRQRESLGKNNWNKKIEKDLIVDVINKASKTSRLTAGQFLDVPITNYTITYLYKDTSKKMIRGWHAILKDTLYLPNVFLENTYDNGTWMKPTDKEWPQNNNFNLDHTINKADYSKKLDDQLFYSETIHKKIIRKRKTKRK